MNKSAVAGVVTGLVAIIALGVWYWSVQGSTPHPPVAAEAAPQPAAASPAPIAPVAAEPAIRHPIETPAPPASDAARQAVPDPESMLIDLFGRKSALDMFQLDDFARRVVATVDNLGRSQASARLWPMNPALGRFLTETSGDAEVISAKNGQRYTPYVLLFETVDLHRLARAYARLYPTFQKAYEDLGYPGRYFNDRVVEVLDQLIATPDVEGPIKVRRPTINGPMQPTRPWVLYEFEDPALQALTAGQRILLRTGSLNERRLKAKLAELRRLLATGAPKQ